MQYSGGFGERTSDDQDEDEKSENLVLDSQSKITRTTRNLIKLGAYGEPKKTEGELLAMNNK